MNIIQIERAEVTREQVSRQVDAGDVVVIRQAIDDAESFRAMAHEYCGRLASYVYRSTPRTEIGDGVYTASEYSRHERILLHNENSYQRRWPRRLCFGCLEPAARGGETTFASTRMVTAAIDRATLKRFVELGIMYVRTYSSYFDLTWQTTFQTDDPQRVEEYCRREEITFEWLAGGSLRTRQVCHGAATHPTTGELLSLNQAHLFHRSALAADVRAVLLASMPAGWLPRDALYGDGTPIDETDLEAVRRAFDHALTPYQWRRGDFAVFDNMLVAHGREPYSGRRTVLVAMGGECATGIVPASVQRSASHAGSD